jgi:hypothetical protein
MEEHLKRGDDLGRVGRQTVEGRPSVAPNVLPPARHRHRRRPPWAPVVTVTDAAQRGHAGLRGSRGRPLDPLEI